MVIIAGGCAHYDSQPLTRAAVERALTVPPMEMLQGRAAAIDNPLMRPAVIGSPEGLTPDGAAVLAVLLNPTLRANRDRLKLSDAQLIQAGILANPTLDLSSDPVTGGNTTGTFTGYAVGLNWDITALISRNARIAAARKQQASVRLDVAWQEWQVAQAGKKAAYDLIALRAQVQLAREIERGLAQNLTLVRRAVEGHNKTLLELSAAQTASNKARLDLLTLQSGLRHQELALNQALGSLEGEPMRLQPFPLPSRLDLPSQAQFLDGLEDRRLDLVALRRGYDAQEETVRAAVLSQFPKLVLGMHHARDTSNVVSDGPNAALDLPIFDRNQGNIAIERATRQRLFDEYIARVFDARASIALALADIQSLTEQIADAEASIPALEELVSVYGKAMVKGNADVLSYYTAQSDLTSRQLDLLRLRQQLLQNKVVLEIAAGMYLPDGVPTTRPTTMPTTMPTTGPATRSTTAPANSQTTAPKTAPTTKEVSP